VLEPLRIEVYSKRFERSNSALVCTSEVFMGESSGGTQMKKVSDAEMRPQDYVDPEQENAVERANARYAEALEKLRDPKKVPGPEYERHGSSWILTFPRP
jgi:hypothetical protein